MQFDHTKTCPACDKEREPKALECDCGFNFIQRTGGNGQTFQADQPVNIEIRYEPDPWLTIEKVTNFLLAVGSLVALVVGIIGLFLGWFTISPIGYILIAAVIVGGIMKLAGR